MQNNNEIAKIDSDKQLIIKNNCENLKSFLIDLSPSEYDNVKGVLGCATKIPELTRSLSNFQNNAKRSIDTINDLSATANDENLKNVIEDVNKLILDLDLNYKSSSSSRLNFTKTLDDIKSVLSEPEKKIKEWSDFSKDKTLKTLKLKYKDYIDAFNQAQEKIALDAQIFVKKVNDLINIKMALFSNEGMISLKGKIIFEIIKNYDSISENDIKWFIQNQIFLYFKTCSNTLNNSLIMLYLSKNKAVPEFLVGKFNVNYVDIKEETINYSYSIDLSKLSFEDIIKARFIYYRIVLLDYFVKNFQEITDNKVKIEVLKQIDETKIKANFDTTEKELTKNLDFLFSTLKDDINTEVIKFKENKALAVENMKAKEDANKLAIEKKAEQDRIVAEHQALMNAAVNSAPQVILEKGLVLKKSYKIVRLNLELKNESTFLFFGMIINFVFKNRLFINFSSAIKDPYNLKISQIIDIIEDFINKDGKELFEKDFPTIKLEEVLKN